MPSIENPKNNDDTERTGSKFAAELLKYLLTDTVKLATKSDLSEYNDYNFSVSVSPVL